VNANPPEASSSRLSPETSSLLDLIDRLDSLLERSELVELEVEAGETAIVLRKPAALAPSAHAAAAASGSVQPAAPHAPPVAVEAEMPSHIKIVKAPLTGVFYGSPSPTAPPFVTVGQTIHVGQVIGLIEAMKLFNEIKSDQAGRVVRIVAESGKLVKVKAALIEVEP
jgi:acetyl-CoA carboxylase biotin carboxyl carrier protein